MTKKSVPKITEEIGKLINRKIIMEAGSAASTGGRRAMQYTLCLENLPQIVTIAIDQYFTTIAVVNFNNEFIVYPKRIPLDMYGDKKGLSIIMEAVKKVLLTLPDQQSFVVGVTMPGFVDSENGLNRSFPADSNFYSVKIYIEKSLGLPVQIANDSSAIAIAEHRFGQGRGYQDVLVVNLNWGVGLGIIIENHIYKGHAGYAGEFSHIPLANSQRLCSCGKKGCLEVEASLSFALDYVTKCLRNAEPSSLQSVFQKNGTIGLDDLVCAFEAGDQTAIKGVKTMTHMLGKGLATLIHIMNPQRIIISGNGAAFGAGLLPTIETALQEYCIPRLSRSTKVSVSDLAYVQIISTACTAVQQMNTNQFQHNKNKLQQR
ncbi:ROK family protein [Sphingobacterium shayense]|uniref:ROK family protein n=1 Tax=Sphingobacterium shayense TaxID=626343 RepID=UPI0015571015|nr:ROK family protein [Sphingobacterium shayense]NQD71576.1 ROK family protein [Sphingobacterium shayense]